MLKRLTACALATCLFITSACACSVNDNFDNFESIDATVISEYEAVLQQEREFVSVYGRTNRTNSPMEEYKKAFDERASLPKDVLEKMGYSEEDISLLKAYKLGTKSFEEAASRASAVLSTLLSCSTYTPERYTVRYTWRWDKASVGAGNGCAALTLQALSEDGQSFVTKIDRKNAQVTYCAGGGPEQTEGADLSVQWDCVTASYAPYKPAGDGHGWMWARFGYLEVTVSPAVPGGAEFASVRARGEMGIPADAGGEFLPIQLSERVFSNRGTYQADFSPQ